MRSRIILTIACLLGSLSIYCAQQAVAPEAKANAGGSTGAPSGSCCDTTPKWSKIAETTLTGKNGAGTAFSSPFDVSGFKELSIIRKCEKATANPYAYPSWGAEADGVFGEGAMDRPAAERFSVLAPFMKISVSSTDAATPVTCTVVLLGVK